MTFFYWCNDYKAHSVIFLRRSNFINFAWSVLEKLRIWLDVKNTHYQPPRSCRNIVQNVIQYRVFVIRLHICMMLCRKIQAVWYKCLCFKNWMAKKEDIIFCVRIEYFYWAIKLKTFYTFFTYSSIENCQVRE